MNKVEFKKVYMKYEGASEPSLSDISFSVMPGEIVGIIGGTGSGKTTLVSMIPGFYLPESGKIYVDGADTAGTDICKLRRKIGFCFQKYYLFKGTIRDNVSFGAENASDDDVKEALKIAQGLDFVMDKPRRLDEPVSEKGTNLSGGQKQRLMIARALIRKPEILILDDSSSALDYATDKKLRQALSGLTDTTTFLVSQRTSTVINADKIIVLDDGKIVGIGKHAELLENNTVYREIYESQTKDK